ncbi:MAG: NAD(P)/FAD-dependent oxidoreductase [Actinomycetota bacterium]|nr:NAD(P)/FAD-dependent oxidoreductase [Actinomycetota bacterium]MDD5667438.1 NAD(P)/FAD-dependent oxidoreductase [Actinomycetota bacterium]
MGKQVVVIGAGCAGLAATYTLKKAGVDVVALEAGDRPGGRCWNMRRDGFLLPVGAGLTETQWAVTHKFVRELGMSDQTHIVEQLRLGFWRNGKISYLLKGTPMQMVKNVPEMLRFRGWPLKAYPQAAKLVLAMLKYMRRLDHVTRDFEPLMELGDVSSARFALEHGGPEILDHLISPFLGTMVLARPDEVTIAHLIALAFLMGGVCVMENGMGSINEGLYEKVKDDVRLSTPVTRVVIEDRKVKGVETEGGFIEAGQVICATDAVLARQLIPDLPDTMRKPLETCEYSSSYNYIFALEKKITPEYFVATLIPGSERSILTTIFEIAGGGMKTAPEGAGLMYAFTAGWHDRELGRLSEDERRRRVIAEVQKYWPEFPDEPLFTECIRWPRAVNLETPGQFPAIHEFLKHHARDVKGLHLAGEYLFLIACTEGAFATGEQAANMVLEDM